MNKTPQKKIIYNTTSFTVLVLLLGALVFGLSQMPCKKNGLDIWSEYQKKSLVTDTQEKLEIIIADTPNTRHTGLSGTTSLPPGTGMWFVFPALGHHSFWMKDMNYAIDIFWFDGSYDLVHSERNVSPDTFPQSFGSEVASMYVLETRVGELGVISNIEIQDVHN